MPSRNHEKFVCQGALTPHNALVVFSIKSSLIDCLCDYIQTEYEEEESSFICLSHNRKTDPLEESTPCQRSPIGWSEIPLKQKRSDVCCLYISPLPQILKSRGYLNSARSLTAETQQLVEKLNRFQLITDPQAHNYLGNASSFLSNLWKEVKITAQRPGWIALELSNQGMHYWLEQFRINKYSTRPIHTLVIAARLSGQRDRLVISHDTEAKIARYSKAHAKSSELLTKDDVSPSSTQPFSSTLPFNIDSDELSLGDRSRYRSTDISGEDISGDARLWRVQHTFTRCCCYVRTISLEADLAHQPSCRLGALSRPATVLLWVLAETVDTMFWLPYQSLTLRKKQSNSQTKDQLLKQADQLCRSFDRFSRLCLCTEASLVPLCQSEGSSASGPSLLKAHVELVQAVQMTLKTLLDHYLLEAAPETL